MNSSNFDIILKIRKWMLLSSKVIGGLFCVYFIFNAKHYEIQWNLLTWLMPGIALKINLFLSYLGMYLLFIPLSIIIVSLIIPNSMTLNILASFFGVGSTLITAASGIFNHTLTQVYNMKLFVIIHILSMEEKRNIFIAEYKRIVFDKYETSLLFIKYLQEHLEPKYFIIYNEKLKTLIETLEIKIYADEMVSKWADELQALSTPKVIPTNYDNWKLGLYVVGGIVVLITTAVIIRYFLFDNNAIQQAELTKDVAQASEEITNLVNENATAIQNLTVITKTSFEEVRKINVRQDMLQKQLDTLSASVTKIWGLLTKE